jgi:hypothetical protein
MQANQPTTSFRTAARLIGAAFLVSTATYMLGSGLIASALAATEGGQFVTNNSRLVSGVLLQLVNSAAVVAIGVLFYPLLRKWSEPVALGYLSARVIESVLLALGGLATLTVLGTGQGSAAGSAPLLVGVSKLTYQMAMIALGLGSLPFCALLYRTRLIPRWLSALGLVGYASLLVGSVLELYGLDLRLLHNLPGGLFELILPLWLLVRGLNQTLPSDAPDMADDSVRTVAATPR